MPSYNVSIVKQLGAQTWSNRYVIFAADLAAAKAIGNAIVEIERDVHLNIVNFIGMKVENTINFSTDNTVVGLSVPGTGGAPGEYLPLHNTVRIAFHTATGKPSQKYLRLPLDEGYQTNGLVDVALRTTLLAVYAEPLLDIPEFKDVDGQAFTSASVAPNVAARQLDRRRRSRPGFHRGWVAD